jgi:hypothetical protein
MYRALCLFAPCTRFQVTTSFESEIMNSLEGDTPRKKYEYLNWLKSSLTNRIELCELQDEVIISNNLEAYPFQFRKINKLNDDFKKYFKPS